MSDMTLVSRYSLTTGVTVTTMSNSRPYPVTPVASQLYSSTPVAHHLLRSQSRSYTSVKYNPWSNPDSVLTTPHRLPCLVVSSPCTCYILHLVPFHRTWFILPGPDLVSTPVVPCPPFRLFTCHRKYLSLVLT